MNAIGVVPARLGASRFPGKPLAALLGMPMIGHCYHRTRLTPGLQGAYVATCDQEIASYVNSIGGMAIMTSKSHTRATTRTAEAVAHIEARTGVRPDVVVMVQGDEPLIQPATIAETLRPFLDPTVEIVNIISRLRTEEQSVDKNNVKVVVSSGGDALYFSREPIPSPWRGWKKELAFQQTGIIAFRRDVLDRLIALPESPLEQTESVDMNRVLEAGGRIRTVLTENITVGVDTPEELQQAEKLLANDSTLALYLNT